MKYSSFLIQKLKTKKNFSEIRFSFYKGWFLFDSLPGRGGGNGDVMKSLSKSAGGIKVGEMTAGQLLNSAKNMLKQGAAKF